MSEGMISRLMHTDLQNRRITRSMTKNNQGSNDYSNETKLWKYKYPRSKCGIWYLHELPEQNIKHLVGFNGPLRLNTGVLHHSFFGDWHSHLSGLSNEELTKKQIIYIGKKDQPVTLKQIKDAFNRIPRDWYAEYRTFWFEGIDYIKSRRYEYIWHEKDKNYDYGWDFAVAWGT